MSRAYEYAYEIERRRRQEITNERIRTTTRSYLANYQEKLSDFINKGYNAYIPDEISKLKDDLDSIGNLLQSEPFEARNISFTVAAYINQLEILGENAIKDFDIFERQRAKEEKLAREEKKAEKMSLYFELIKTIKNPMVITYAKDNLSKLRKNIEENGQISTEFIEDTFHKIVNDSENKVKEWKNNTLKENEKEISNKQIEELKITITNEKIENKDKTTELLELLGSIKIDNENDRNRITETSKRIDEIKKKLDDEKISEAIRREAVIGIVKQLKNQEFTVEAPSIIREGENSYVKIQAKKPSGKKAVCKIDSSGKIIYKFDNYEGMTCLKDIEKFNIDLEKIYSVKLSNERVLWSNPNKIEKDAVNEGLGGTISEH